MESVTNMSSLKKHTFTTIHPSIALHDFTNNATLFHHNNGVPTPADSTVTSSPSSPLNHSVTADEENFNQWLNHYMAAKKAIKSANFSAHQTNADPLESKKSNTPGGVELTPYTTALESAQEKSATRTIDFWVLTQQDRVLVKGGVQISLTTIESALIKKMLHHEERVVSKEELIRNIGREPEFYRGLEMCLSRLQDKFKRVNDGERLFRAVRNRGYCLTQKIKKPLEGLQPRR